MILREYRAIRRNSRIIDDYVDYESYDIIIADESWELLESRRFLKAGSKKVFMTDFLKYPYNRLADIPGAFLFNRYLWRRLGYFDLVIFVGFPDKMRSLDEVKRTGINVVSMGLIPPMLESEVLDAGKARRLVGAASPAILVSLGGTRAGLDIMGQACEILSRGVYDVYMAPGASIGDYRPDNCKMIRRDLKFKVQLIIRAFDVVVSLGGLSSLAASISEGVPTVTIPLPGHFEQEENAILASNKYAWILSLKHNEIGEIPVVVEELASRGHSSGDKSLYRNQASIARYIKEAI